MQGLQRALLARKGDVRAWAAQHWPELLQSRLLAEPAPESTPAVEAATIAGPGAGVHRIQSRTAPLDSLIIKARREASDPNDRHAVFAVLQAWAESGTCPAPIVGYAEGDGIKYRDGDGFKYLTSDNLRKRAAMTRALPPSAA